MILTRLKTWFDQPPSAYRPGHALLCALKDMRGTFNTQSVELDNAVITSCNGSALLTVSERIECHFRMHIVSLEMKLAVAAEVKPGIRINVRNSGLLFRTGITCAVTAEHREALKGITSQIIEDPELFRSLMTLDFRRCRLESTDLGWTVLIEPYGASEVINTMPTFRRYIRMDKCQVKALSEAFSAFQRILSAA